MGQKFVKYVALMSGISLLFYFTGLVESNPLIDMLLRPEGFTSSSIYLSILSALSAISGILVGFITRDFDKGFMIAFLPALLALLWNFISVYNVFLAAVPWFAILVLSPIYMVFIMAGIDYYRGKD